MKSTWRVETVTMTEGQTLAEMVKVEWFRKNPEYQALMDEYDDLVESVSKEEADRITAERHGDDEWVEEFLDTEPGEEGAEFIESVDGTKRLTLDITDGLDLRPGDNVVMVVDALERVPA